MHGSAVAAAIARCVRQSRWSEGLQVLSLHREPLSSRARSASIAACGKGRRWQAALALLCSGPKDDVVLFNAAAAACGSSAQWQQALEVLQSARIWRLELDVTGANTLISACGRAARWELALAMALQRTPGLPVCGAKGLGAAIHACGRAGQWREALQLLSHVPPPRLSIGCYNAAMAAASHSLQWAHAVALLARLALAGLEANAITGASMVHILGLAGKWQLAMAVQNLGGRNAVVENSLVAACARAGHWELALLVAEAHGGLLSSDSVARGAVAVACARALRWQQALRLHSTTAGLAATASASAACGGSTEAAALMGRRVCRKLRSAPGSCQQFGACLLAVQTWHGLVASPGAGSAGSAGSAALSVGRRLGRLHQRRVEAPALQHLDPFAFDRDESLLAQLFDLGPALSRAAAERRGLTLTPLCMR
ncbi:unnamed protein product [Effrenium voratum]|uniref:Pentatricopeptide repeat-containing protein, chloroplastic n=1 Tax=Effrenium voratum TaxID=2562239 RepID=A0AA36MQD1_9DINO|nr:unnamed protein product [Effrenium voratum]